jgi:uncharacterized protein (TIGR03067 family)
MRWHGLIAALAFLGPAAEPADRPQEALQGTWTVIAAEQDGRPLDRIKGNALTVEGSRFLIKTKGSDLKGTIDLHAGARPTAMDLTHTEGEVVGRTWYAIYSLERDVLKICYLDPNPDNTRPGGFETAQGSNALMVTLERDSP